MRIEFEQSRRPAAVNVEITRNDDPAAVGCPECARGFPICRATVEPAARGYNDILGWVQLVDATDLFGEFRNDPFEPIDTDPSHPFCFYGFAPTLLDLPHREHREDTDFLAHSFLCDLGDQPLEGAAWDDQLPYLRRTFPVWEFLPS